MVFSAAFRTGAMLFHTHLTIRLVGIGAKGVLKTSYRAFASIPLNGEQSNRIKQAVERLKDLQTASQVSKKMLETLTEQSKTHKVLLGVQSNLGFLEHASILKLTDLHKKVNQSESDVYEARAAKKQIEIQKHNVAKELHLLDPTQFPQPPSLESILLSET